MGSFLVGLGIICFDFAVNGLVPTIIYAIVWGFVLLMIVFTILTQFEERLDMNWRRIAGLKLLCWRKKTRVEEENEEADHQSITTTRTADPVRSRGTRFKFGLFMSRKKDSQRDSVYDLAR